MCKGMNMVCMKGFQWFLILEKLYIMPNHSTAWPTGIMFNDQRQFLSRLMCRLRNYRHFLYTVFNFNRLNQFYGQEKPVHFFISWQTIISQSDSKFWICLFYLTTVILNVRPSICASDEAIFVKFSQILQNWSRQCFTVQMDDPWCLWHFHVELQGCCITELRSVQLQFH